MSQTLKIPTNSLKRVKTAMEKQGISSQKSLAEVLEISLYKVREFMAGRPIDAITFIQICERLELDWQKITRISAAKADEILGNEPTIVLPPTSVNHPAIKRASIPRLASHLFRSQINDSEASIPELVVEQSEASIPELVVEQSEASIPELVVEQSEASIPELVVEQSEASIPELVVEQSEASIPELVVEQSEASIPELVVEQSEASIPELVVEQSEASIPELVVEQSEASIPELVVEALSNDEIIVTEEGNLPILEAVVPHKEPPIEWETLLSAIQTLIDNEEWDEAAELLQQFDLCPSPLYIQLLELAEQLFPPHWRRGGRRISEPTLHGWMLSRAGIWAHHLDLFSQALPYLESALKITRQHPDRGLELQCFKGLANLHQSLGNYQAAISYYQQYFDLAETEALAQEQAYILHQLGNIYYALHQYRTAIGYYNQFLNHNAQEHLSIETLKTLRNIGTCYINLKQYENAIAHLQKLAELTENDRAQEAYTAIQLGIAYAGMGLHHTALEYLEQSRSIATPLDQPALELQAVRGLTLSYVAQQNYPQADRWGREWLTLARLLANRDEQVRALYYLRQLNRSIA